MIELLIEKNEIEAVVIDRVEAISSPSLGDSKILFYINEGAIVEVLDEKNQLMEIILIDGKEVGFIKCSKKNAMKIKYLILLINLLNAQDSLYWFDMSTVRDPVPIAPKILDAIYGKSQLNDLDSLKNIRATTRNGFRIQLYESSSSEKVNNLIKNIKRK